MQQPRIVVPLLLALGLALRLPGLGESLWFDEVLYGTRSQAHDWPSLAHFALYGPFAPLYPVVSFIWTGFFGEREVVVRLPSLLSGLATIPQVLIIARRYGGGWMPPLAALILCLSPVHVWYSQEAAPYMFTTACALAAILAHERVTAAAVASRWDAAYVAALLATVMSHFFAAALLLPLVIVSLRAPAAGRRRTLIATAAVAILLALVIGFKFSHGALLGDRGFLRPFTAFEWWMLFFNWYLLGNSLWPVSPYRTDVSALLHMTPLVIVQIAAAILVVRGLLPDRADGNRRSRIVELGMFLLAVPAAAWLLTTLGHRQVYVERYLLFALPFFAVALARGATRSLRAGAALALAGWVVVLTAGSYVACLERPTAWTVYKHNPDWQAAARYLAEQSFNPDPLVVFAVVPIDDLRFYVRRDVRGRHAQVMTYSEAALDDALSGRGSGPLYLVNNLYWPGDFDRVLERFLRDGHLTQIDARTFAGVTLYAFRPASVNDR